MKRLGFAKTYVGFDWRTSLPKALGWLAEKRADPKRAYDFAEAADAAPCQSASVQPSLKVGPLSQVPVVSIVDDDESVRTAMSSLLRSLGYKTCIFASAEAFLSSPRLHDTSCLIVDVQMPGMTGLDLQADLNVCRPSLPVIFITGLPEERLRRRAKASGAVGFFSKPVDGSMIISCLDGVLRPS
ncbi:MAG: response regulator [Alphaproteobacteria bacterium]|nr:response regulator [Alphaproteobacteria bacterium]